MAEKNVKKVSTWKLLLVLMIVVWMINLVMSFAFNPPVLGSKMVTCILISLFQTVIVTMICYFFYALFFKKGKEEKGEDD